MKRFFLIVAALTMLMQVGRAQNTCETATYVDSTLSLVITSPGEYWFHTWTYDLPLNLNFAPGSGLDNTTPPSAWVDFTCVPGVYDDSIMQNLFTGDSYFIMPSPISFNVGYDNGVKVYNLKVDKNYREMISAVGLTGDVHAFVKVVFPEGGDVYAKPDSLFRNCMDNSVQVALGDTLQILPNDTDRVFVLPYSEWRNDSIRYIWKGTRPARIWLGSDDCGFILDEGDPHIWDVINMNASDTAKLTAAEVQQNVNNYGNGGIFYARVATTGGGNLIIERVPEREPDAGTIALRYGQAANSTKTYYMTRSQWQGATLFESPSTQPVQLLVATTSTAATASDPSVVGAFALDVDESASSLYLSATEMANLWAQTSEKWLYVRFVSASSTTVTPRHWAASDCEDRSSVIRSAAALNVPARSSSVIYRLPIAAFENDSLYISWTGTSTCPTYIADTCVFNLSATNKRLAHYKSIARGATVGYSTTDLAGWRTKRAPDADGYYYVRFNPTAAGNVTFRSTKAVVVPEDTVPEAPVCAEAQSFVRDTMVCDTLMPYTWYGHIFSAAATYRDTLRTAAGCDSIIRSLTLATETCVRPCPTPQSIVADTTVCDTLLPITWRGHEFAAAGTYRDTLRNEDGCDILYRRLRLTTVTCLRPEPEEDDTTTIVPTPDVPLLPTTVQVTCPSDALADVNITVTEEQPLYLYDQYGNIVWQQVPAVPGVTYTVVPQCGVKYTLRGKKNTIKIVR